MLSIDVVRACLGGPEFPFLVDDALKELTDQAWKKLNTECGVSTADYGTGRVLLCDNSAERTLLATVRVPLNDGATSIGVELLTKEVAQRYQTNGISFYSPEEVSSAGVLDCLNEAIEVLGRVAGISLPISLLVRSLHLIHSEQEDCDISFSEPHLPFSIFVSVPTRRVRNDALRVAEGILHEAMHLHLTLIERVVPLTVPGSSKYFSPWRNEHRTAQGVLHAIYVFSAIHYFYCKLSSTFIRPDDMNYITKRLAQIGGQLWQVRSFADCIDLTDEGLQLARLMLDQER